MARLDPDNIARFWWNRGVPGLSLMHADFHTRSFAPHRHEAIVITATEVGGSMIKSCGSVERADESTLFVFNLNEPHESWMGASRHWCFRSFYFDHDALREIAQGLNIEVMPSFSQNALCDGYLNSKFLALHHAIEDVQDALYERELLLSCFGALIERHGTNHRTIHSTPLDRSRLSVAIDYVHAMIAKPPSLRELCSKLEISEFQLIRLFKHMTGLTPYTYVTQLKLDVARKSLVKGVSLKEAAASSGFYDQSSFTNHFKRCYGITPLQFVRATRS